MLIFLKSDILDADRAALQAVVATAQSKAKAAYTAASYADLETELAESVELLSRGARTFLKRFIAMPP